MYELESSLETVPTQTVPTTVESHSIPSVGSPLTDEEILQRSIDEIVVKISEFERLDIVEQLRILLLTRLRNEYFIADMIKIAVTHDKFSVEKAVDLLKASKDGLSQLGTLLRLFEGESTSNTESKVRVEHVDITERLSALGGGVSLPSRN